MRLVSICPSNTEILCALGLETSLVGLDRSSDWPPSIQGLPRMGPDLEVDIEKIAALKPDLVFSSLSVPGMEKNLERLDAAGIPHIVLDAQSISGIKQSFLSAGRALGRGQQARELVEAFEAELSGFQAPSVRPVVFLEWWPKPIITPGKHCWTTEMIQLAGGIPAFGELPVRSTPILSETVLERKPDLLLTCWCGVPHERQKPESLTKRPGWEELESVQKGRYYAADEHYFGRPGPRVVEGIKWLNRLILELNP
jgi:iron complex transport system substrate-binding protein